MCVSKKDKQPNGRIYLSSFKSYGDPATKKDKLKAVKSLGFMVHLPESNDPVAHFTQLAKQMTEEEMNDQKIVMTFFLRRDWMLKSKLTDQSLISLLVRKLPDIITRTKPPAADFQLTGDR